MKDFDFKKAVVIEGAEFSRQDWENGGNLSLWVGLEECDGKKYWVTYAFERNEIEDENGNDVLPEDFPWDEEHVYDVKEVD